MHSGGSTVFLSQQKNQTPVIAFGEEDILFSPDESCNILKLIPGAKFSFIERAAHSIIYREV